MMLYLMPTVTPLIEEGSQLSFILFMGYVAILCFSVFSLGLLVMAIRERSKKFVVGFLIVLFSTIIVFLAVAHSTNERKEAVQKTNSNIEKIILEKYSITLNEKPFKYIRLHDEDSGTYNFSSELILAENSNGEDIKVSLELTKGGSDVAVFISNEALKTAPGK